MEIQEIFDFDPTNKSKEALKFAQSSQDLQMTSSTISSLASPGDSGVQLLDSESEITSVMSSANDESISISPKFIKDCEEKEAPEVKREIMTRSDIANQNVTQQHQEFRVISASVPNYFDKFEITDRLAMDKSRKDVLNKSLSDEVVFEMEHPIKDKSLTESDLMNVSLNSYELLDYTVHNKKIAAETPDLMHVSMSEEVNENLKITLLNSAIICDVPPIVEDVPVENVKPVEEQIVFRRQRKKKSKSDTPKKRVSFHEDILNSTKIDDIHINHGFITHEPDVSLSFFQRGFVRKPDVVKGRYSWAAEGDAPYYEKTPSEREIKSDLYINNRVSSTSSSSSTESTSSSIDEEDNNNSDETLQVKKEPTLKQPKSSCLKKTSNKKYIDTNIVEEETNNKRKKSESNLLDTNIFGSLKNILNFSTSVPLAERGVPEGQEDVTVYASSNELNRRKSCSNFTFIKGFDSIEVPIEAPPVVAKNAVSSNKTNLKLTKSEGFYPNYPPNQQNLPANIIVCDSNVYEHKGISYSYEYDKFQKSFERQQETKPKSSTVYQKILKELNFFRKRARESDKAPEDFEIVPATSSEAKSTKNDSVEEMVPSEEPDPNKSAKAAKMDWSDTETAVSELSENPNNKHLNSPKRRVSKTNHYSISPFRGQFVEPPKSSDSGGENPQKPSASSSKSSLINRFLRNVTLKKMLDLKAQNKQKNNCTKYLPLYVRDADFKYRGRDDLDRALDEEIATKSGKNRTRQTTDMKLSSLLKREIFRNRSEDLANVFRVRSAYATNGNSRPLLAVLTDTTLYITGSRPDGNYCNHFVLPYTELDTVLIGPNGQTVHLSNGDKDMRCIVTTGCAKLTSELIGALEMAMRRDLNKPRLPAVRQLSMRDMANLRRAICKQTSVAKDEEYFYYSIVDIQDFNTDVNEVTPLGPNKEGPLMFRAAEGESRWETAYFILKAGVLYMLSSACHRVPMQVFPLINGSCQGARRTFNSPRPHTFQLIVDGKSLHLAAPDEYVASDWLQSLVHAASGGFATAAPRERMLTQSCSLLMTCDHILTVREAFPCTVSSLLPGRDQHQPIKGAQVLSCAAIVDLMAFRLPSAEQSWCVLEFSCREVHECSGDWILYFATNAELENFISTLEVLWAYNNEDGDSFPLSTIPETDPLSKKCVDIYTVLKNSWPANTVHLQFL